MNSQEKIAAAFDSLRDVVLEKNRRYGDSAFTPIGVFNKGDAISGLCTRLDDKLGRVKNGSELRKNDISDLVGYLVLLCIAKGWTDFSEQVD